MMSEHLDISGLSERGQMEVRRVAEMLRCRDAAGAKASDNGNGPLTADASHGRPFISAPGDDPRVPTRGYAEQANSSAVTKDARSFAPPRGFGWAIKQLHNGARVTRAGWNGRHQWVGLQLPDERSYMTLPYLYIRTVQGDRVPWLASQTDMLATDWQIT